MNKLLLSFLLVSSFSFAGTQNKAEVEEFDTSKIVISGNEYEYLISPASDKDGLCKMLTEEDNAVHVSWTKKKINAEVVTEIEAHPYNLAVIDESGNMKKTKSVLGRFNGHKFISQLICSYTEVSEDESESSEDQE